MIHPLLPDHVIVCKRDEHYNDHPYPCIVILNAQIHRGGLFNILNVKIMIETNDSYLSVYFIIHCSREVSQGGGKKWWQISTNIDFVNVDWCNWGMRLCSALDFISQDWFVTTQREHECSVAWQKMYLIGGRFPKQCRIWYCGHYYQLPIVEKEAGPTHVGKECVRICKNAWESLRMYVSKYGIVNLSN